MRDHARTPPELRELAAAVVAERVLPRVRNHGGDIEIGAIGEDGEVTCRLHGACRGCPSAAVTLIAVVETALRTHVDDRLRVVSPQVAVSAAAIARIRGLYGARVGGPQRRSAVAGE